MAERLQAAAKDDLDAQLTTGWHHAFAGPPRPSSFPSRASLSTVKPPFKQRKDKTLNSPPYQHCQALMSANKFVYVE